MSKLNFVVERSPDTQDQGDQFRAKVEYAGRVVDEEGFRTQSEAITWCKERVGKLIYK